MKMDFDSFLSAPSAQDPDSPGKITGVVPFPLPEDRPNPGTKPASPAAPALQADSLPLDHQGSPLIQHFKYFLSE